MPQPSPLTSLTQLEIVTMVLAFTKIVKKSFTALLLLTAALALVPAATAEPFCEIEPCCVSGPMDCCTIESAPAPSPELVITESVRVSQSTVAIAAAVPSFEEAPVPEEPRAECPSFAESPPDRLALLSTYLI